MKFGRHRAFWAIACRAGGQRLAPFVLHAFERGPESRKSTGILGLQRNCPRRRGNRQIGASDLRLKARLRFPRGVGIAPDRSRVQVS